MLNNIRTYKITQASYIFCGLIHFIGIFISWFLGIKELFLFNTFISVPCFIAAYYLNFKERPNIAFSIAFFELMCHQILGIYLLGWAVGFQYFLVLLATLSFFNTGFSRRTHITITCIIGIVYTLLYLTCQAPHKYILNPVLVEAGYITSFVSFFIFLTLIINYYTITSFRSEAKLEFRVRKRTRELEKSRRSAIQMLGEAGHFNDSDTGSHIWRMAKYSKLIAEYAGWDKKRVRLIELAAAMHDTGKIATPDSILKKPGKLDEEEWKIMKEHSQAGCDILSKSDAPVFKMAAEIACSHHEKWDGSGYPKGLKGKEIPESARITAIADVFDALTSDRPYKKAWTHEEALREIKNCSGTHFDPELVNIFMQIQSRVTSVRLKYNQMP